MLWLTLFELKGHGRNDADRLECVKTAIAEFEPRRMVTSSPEKLEPETQFEAVRTLKIL